MTATESGVAASAGVAATTVLPTSFAQRRLWFLHRLDPASSAYNVPVAARLRGGVDPAVLERAVAALVARHEVLQTRFGEVDGEPVQLIGDPAPVPLVVQDVDGQAGVDEAVSVAASTPFDLATGPPARFLLLRPQGDPVLVVTVHHIAVDGWSLSILFRDLAELYAAELAGRPAVLPELSVQYADFAVWQRRQQGVEARTADVEYWRRQLAGAPEHLELPTERPRGARSGGAGAVATARWSPGLAEDVVELAAVEGVTPYMVLLAAFATVLARYSGATEVVVGSPVAGRARPELDPLIGCFINTLPIRTDLSGEPTFRELLARVRRTTLDAYEHQWLSFDQIVEVVQPRRGTGDTPVFQVMFSLDNTPTAAVGPGLLDLVFLEPRREQVKYDLNMTASLGADSLHVVVEHRTDLYGPGWVTRFLHHFRTLLTAAVLDPDRAVTELPLLTPAERRQLLTEWNDTVVDFPSAVALPELLRRQVASTPQAVALTSGSAELTYRQLWTRVEVLARRLARVGVRRGDRVGLCLQRSPELVVAILAVLEAGAAYVPLDPDHPAERLAFMLTDAEVRLVLTHRAARSVVPASAETVLELDDLGGGGKVGEGDEAGVVGRGGAGRRPGTAPQQDRPGPGDPAYVIYTSGSTGRPKGVVNTHRGIVNRLSWMQRAFDLGADDAVLHKTPYSFDVSVWEFLWPLMTGARLVVADPAAHKDAAALAAVIRRQQVTTVHFVPSMLQVFLEAVDLATCPSLRRVVCSGEALPAELARRFHSSGSSAELHNLYGPTEAAIDVSHWHCRPEDTGPSVPIGRPIDNTRLYVLDPKGEPVPIGVPGELVIGGVQVAAGYVGRPELTAERFVPDPFAAAGDGWGATLYRTGDLARWRPDGALEFVGRRDHQVKLRGFRIELGEVEVAVRELEGVQDALVTTIGDRLICYVVGDRQQLSGARLREQVSLRLPEYMVPSLVVWLESIPLTANGKADRSALPAPEEGALRPADRIAARDGLEVELVSLWEELLGVSPIGVADDFFALGGSSLQVIRMLGRVTRRYGVELPVAVMFAGGATVERLAVEIRHGDLPRRWSPVVAIRSSGDPPPLFCLPPAVGNALSYVDLARHLPSEQPVYALQAAGLDPGQEPFADLAEAAAAYSAAIRDIQREGPYHLVGYCVGSVVAVAVAQRLAAEGAEIGLLAVLDGGPPSLDNGFADADDAEIAAWFAWELGRAANRMLRVDPHDLRGLGPDGITRGVLEQAIAEDVLPADTAVPQLQRLMATFTAGVRAVRSSVLPPYPGPVVAFRAADEPPENSPFQRLETLVAGGLSVSEVPGDHYTMMRPPNVEVLATGLAAAIKAAARGQVETRA
jgi:amino acid adenylation domain-containing protein